MTVAYAALFGLAFGSFINAAIDRIPRGRRTSVHAKILHVKWLDVKIPSALDSH